MQQRLNQETNFSSAVCRKGEQKRVPTQKPQPNRRTVDRSQKDARSYFASRVWLQLAYVYEFCLKSKQKTVHCYKY